MQSNPFAKEVAQHLNAGTVVIESERAIAEAQGKLVIAKRFPRNQALAYANIIDACKRPGLAEEACYSFPRGGEVVSGPAIRLAEMLAANWGNLDYGLRELSRKDGVSENGDPNIDLVRRLDEVIGELENPSAALSVAQIAKDNARKAARWIDALILRSKGVNRGQ